MKNSSPREKIMIKMLRKVKQMKNERTKEKLKKLTIDETEILKKE